MFAGRRDVESTLSARTNSPVRLGIREDPTKVASKRLQLGDLGRVCPHRLALSLQVADELNWWLDRERPSELSQPPTYSPGTSLPVGHIHVDEAIQTRSQNRAQGSVAHGDVIRVRYAQGYEDHGRVALGESLNENLFDSLSSLVWGIAEPVFLRE